MRWCGKFDKKVFSLCNGKLNDAFKGINLSGFKRKNFHFPFIVFSLFHFHNNFQLKFIKISLTKIRWLCDICFNFKSKYFPLKKDSNWKRKTSAILFILFFSLTSLYIRKKKEKEIKIVHIISSYIHIWVLRDWRVLENSIWRWNPKRRKLIKKMSEK